MPDPRLNDMSLMLTKARLAGFFEDVKPWEVDYLSQAAKTIFSTDSNLVDTFGYTQGVALEVARGALKNRENAPLKILILGDSVLEGTGATVIGNRWCDKFIAGLRTVFPTSGIGSGGGMGYTPLRVAGGAPTPWTLVGSPIVDNGNGFGARALVFTNTGMTATATVTGTSIDICYLKATATRVGSYQIDGGAVTPFETNGGTGIATDDGVLRVPLGASGPHTVKISYASGGAPYIEGIIVYDGDENKGIHLLEAGHSGWESTEFNAGSFATNFTTRIKTHAPQLIVIALGENDYLHAKSSATYKANLISIISKIRAAYTGTKPSFALMLSFKANALGLNSEPWENYINAAREVAEQDTGGLYGRSGVAFFDITYQMPDILGDTTATYGDNYHPNNKGHNDLAYWFHQTSVSKLL